MSEAGLDMMFGLVLENGKRWGEVAAPFQVADVEAVFGESKPHRHFITRPRGGSKTSDISGVALSWLATEAPPLANGHVVASNTDQAAILIDAAAGFVARTPELQGVITVESERLIAPNGSWVRVLAQSDSGSWGLRDAHLLILDEFAQWPETRGAKRVYTAIRSTVQKVDGCRLIILTSAGEPSHWSYGEVFTLAKADKLWRVSEAPGPVPWQDKEEIEALRRELLPSQFDRLVMNIWSEDEDRAISPEDYEIAALPARPLDKGFRLRNPEPDTKYIITVDIGILHDATVLCVAHKEPMEDGEAERVVIDHLERWKGSKKNPVQVSQVEDWLALNAPVWNRAQVYADPDQFRGNIQNLNKRGVRAQEWNFTATSVGKVASALVQTFRNHQIWIPDTPALKTELLQVRLRESAPGVTRLDHDSTGHDDQAVVIGMACHILIGQTKWGAGAGFVQFMKNQIATRPEKKRMDPRDRAKRRCEHRWRPDNSLCAFCGQDRKTVLNAPAPQRSLTR